MKEAFEACVTAKPPEANNNRCHNCDMPFVPDQWDVREVGAPDTVGKDWLYTCPSCNEETVQIGI
jgi:hypothetical protein